MRPEYSEPGVGRRAAHLLLCGLLSFLCLTCGITARAATKDERLDQAERALRKGELILAERLFRELIAKDGRDLAAHLGLSKTLLKKRDLSGAFDQAGFVLAHDRYSARARSLAGTVLSMSGNFQLAREQFEAALQIEQEPLAIAGLATIDFYENRLEESRRGLRQAVRLEPAEPDFIFLLALTAVRLERYGEAADAYSRFLEVAPNNDEERRARIKGLIDFLRYLKGQKRLYSIEGARRAEIPLELVDNLPVIEVRPNGSNEVFRFVLDSGSGMTVISEETAERLGIKAAARGGSASAIGGRFKIVYGLLSSLEIGPTRIRNVPVYIRHFFHSNNRIDGYLGLMMISRFVTTVDYGARSLTLSRGSSTRDTAAAAEPPALEIPLRMTPGGFLSSGVEIGGLTMPLNFIVDTGASISVLSKRLESHDEIRSFKPGQKLRVYGAAGIEDDVLTLLLPRLTLGSCGRENVLAALLDLDAISETAGFEQAGIVGGNFLRHFRVTFDLKRSAIRLSPLGPALLPTRGTLSN